MCVVVISVDLSYFTDGDSSLHDGTPLVGQFVARVRTSSHSKKFIHLLSGECCFQGIPILFVSFSYRIDSWTSWPDPRLRSEVLSTSACKINGLLFSGSRMILHCLVEILQSVSTSLSSFHSP